MHFLFKIHLKWIIKKSDTLFFKFYINCEQIILKLIVFFQDFVRIRVKGHFFPIKTVHNSAYCKILLK